MVSANIISHLCQFMFCPRHSEIKVTYVLTDIDRIACLRSPQCAFVAIL